MKSDDLARSTLEKMGYEVSPIPISDEVGRKEADFIVSYQTTSALVEAKLKENDPKKEREREKTLSSGKPYSSDHVGGRNETISKIISYGSQQLRSSGDKKHDFKILFFIADCINAKVVSEQFIETIYGCTDIIHLENQLSIKKCYFYRSSDFHRKKIIDAAIVGYISNEKIHLKICLNPYSENYPILKKSEFLIPFATNILDPIEEEKIGKAYIPDENIQRKQDPFGEMFPQYNRMLAHLAQKYKTGKLAKADWHKPEITARSSSKKIS
ncbi:MAG: hypothetical protein M3R45_06170 [Pseudomonadota bacterium]|nr:hypothetical protein [Pseudomonadota bacterium]